MTKDEFQVTESILFAYPEVCRALDQRREYLISLALTRNPGDHVQGGTGLTAIERFADGDKESRNLQAIIDRVIGCLEKLRAEEGEFVRKYYFERAGVYAFDQVETLIFRKRQKICDKLLGVMSVYGLLRGWRDVEKKRMLDAAKKRGAL